MVAYTLIEVCFIWDSKISLGFREGSARSDSKCRCLDVCMATLTLEGSADQANNGSLEEGEQLVATGEGDDVLIGEPPGVRQPRTCCGRCAAIVQVCSKHRYERVWRFK